MAVQLEISRGFHRILKRAAAALPVLTRRATCVRVRGLTGFGQQKPSEATPRATEPHCEGVVPLRPASAAELRAHRHSSSVADSVLQRSIERRGGRPTCFVWRGADGFARPRGVVTLCILMRWWCVRRLHRVAALAGDPGQTEHGGKALLGAPASASILRV